MNDTEKILSFLHQRDAEFDQIIKEYFGNLFLSSHGNAGPDFYARISNRNEFFENTEYYYKGPYEFFHLTSISNLFSILNSKTFRLYNVHSSADPDEFSYAALALRLSEEEIAFGQQNLFTMSFCPISELSNSNVWKVYGRNFSGASIVFEILNDPKGWRNFHISEVKYSEPLRFSEYKEKLNELSRKSSFNFNCDLSKLIGFYKKQCWQNEKEVRLITYCPFEDNIEFLKYTKPEVRIEKGRNRVTRYIELPLWETEKPSSVKFKNEEPNNRQILPPEFFVDHPQIQIKRIEIGVNSGIDTEFIGQFRSELKHLVFNNYGYEIEVAEKFVEP